MSFGGGGAGGQIRYIISVDDSQAIQKLQGVAQQFQALGTTTQQTTQQMEQMPTVYDEIATGADKVAQSQQTMTEGIKAQGDEVKKSTVAQQSWGSTLKNNIFAITSAVGGIISLVQQYTSLQRAQLVIQKMTNTEIGQRNKIAELTRKHAQAVKEFGASSQEVLKIETDLDLLQKKHEVTVKTLEIRQEQLNLRMADFGLNILPNLMSAGGGIAQVIIGLKGLKTGQDAAGVAAVGMGVKMKGALIGTGIGAIIVAIGAFLVAFTRNLYGVQDAVFGLGQKIGAAVPQLQGFLNMLKDAGIWLIRILGGELPAGADKAAESIAGVSEEAGEFAESATDAAAAAEEMKKQTESVKSSYASFMGVLKTGKDAWGETKKLLKDIGFGKGAIEKIHLGIEFEFEKPQEALKNLEIGLNAIREFHLSPSTQKEVANNFVEDMRKSIKKAGGDLDILKELVDIVKKHKKDPNLANLVAGWFAGLPQSVREELIRHGISPDEIITNMGFDPAKMKTEAQASIDKAVGGVKLDVSKIKFTTPEENKKIWAQFGTESTHVTGLLDQITNSFKSFDWSGARNAIAKGLLDKEFWTQVGNVIRGFIGDGLSQESVAGARLAVRNSIATTILDHDFWVQVGIATLGFVVEGMQRVQDVKMGLENLMGLILDRDTWIQVGITTLGIIIEGINDLTKIQEGLTTFGSTIKDNVSSAAQNLLQAGKDIAAKIWDGLVDFFTGKSVWDAFSGQKAEAAVEVPLNVIPKISTTAEKKSFWEEAARGLKMFEGWKAPSMKPISVDVPVQANVSIAKVNPTGGANWLFGGRNPTGGQNWLAGFGVTSSQQRFSTGGNTPQIPVNADVKVGINKVSFLANPGFAGAASAGAGGLMDIITRALGLQMPKARDVGADMRSLWSKFFPSKTTTAGPNVTGGANWLAGQKMGGGDQFGAITTGAQKAQKALANLANQGGNSMSILAKSASAHTRSMNTFLARTIPQAAQRAQTTLANLANQGGNSMSILQSSMAQHTKSINTYLARTIPVAAQKSQTAIANLANEGSDSVSALAKAFSKNMNSIIKSVQAAQRAVISLIKSIGNMKSKTIVLTTIHRTIGIRAQHGFHGMIASPTQFLVGEAGPERVDVTPLSQSGHRGASAGGGTLVVHLHNVNSDRETIRTFRREIGKEIFRFGPT